MSSTEEKSTKASIDVLYLLMERNQSLITVIKAISVQ